MSAPVSAQIERVGEAGWRLSGTLDFESVPVLYRRTGELLASGPVELDLSGIEWANSAGVALLLEWRRQAHRRGVDLRLHSLPESVRRVARLAGVEPLLSGETTGDSVTGSAPDRSVTV